MALLEVQDLRAYVFTKRGIVKAVDGVSFSVDEGETLGLVGESGCGKTMTCHALLKLLPEPGGRLVGGRIIFDGEDLTLKTEAEMRRLRGRRISMILQDPMTSLNPAYTIGFQVGEAISAHERIDGKTLWSKVLDALRLVNIPAAESRLRDYPHQMSGGMRQRVAGAVAFVAQPVLLMADEPTTSLDVTIQEQYLNLLKDLQMRSRVAMIFVTHDFGVVARMCNKVAVMYAGRIVETAGTRELFNHPLHPYTVALMRCLPRLEAVGERLESIAGQPPSLIDLPSSCNFAPRCGTRDAHCREELPVEVRVAEGHYVSCWKYSG